ncbi:hypothetical protein BaRGS_00036691 [Batillaria attramentaria]|uniref:Uncharacterized protein n=1 Tax=Batillaria attramentaria TaxID=370345 RepID=A0ABD0JCI3_9CAEN
MNYFFPILSRRLIVILQKPTHSDRTSEAACRHAVLHHVTEEQPRIKRGRRKIPAQLMQPHTLARTFPHLGDKGRETAAAARIFKSFSTIKLGFFPPQQDGIFSRWMCAAPPLFRGEQDCACQFLAAMQMEISGRT